MFSFGPLLIARLYSVYLMLLNVSRIKMVCQTSLGDSSL